MTLIKRKNKYKSKTVWASLATGPAVIVSNFICSRFGLGDYSTEITAIVAGVFGILSAYFRTIAESKLT